jgi:hypothetical protein
LAVFMDGFPQRGVDTKDLSARIQHPIRFRPKMGRSAYGNEATIRADICDVVLSARQMGEGILLKN